MIDPQFQRLARRKVRVLLLTGLGILLALLLGLGLHAARSLKQLSRSELSAAREYLLRTERLQNAQRFLTSSSGSVRDYILDPNEATLLRHRERARRSWSEAMTFIREYEKIGADRRELTDILDSQLSRYWAAADAALRLEDNRRVEAGTNLLLRNLNPMRDEFLATVTEISSRDRAQIMAEAERTQMLVRSRENSLWIAIGTASILALAVAVVTFTHLMKLERVASVQYGCAVQASAEMQRLSERLLNSQEDERRKIARDLHDDYGQRMASLIFELSSATERYDASPELCIALETMGERLGNLAKDLQQMSRGLHSAVLDKIGLEAAVRSDCDSLSKRSPLRVTFRAASVPRRLPDHVALAVYRISQEAVQNALKHSHTDRLNVSLDLEERELVLRVEDFGHGFDAKDPNRVGSLGLVSMRERLRMVGGAFLIHSEPGRGTQVEARVPLS